VAYLHFVKVDIPESILDYSLYSLAAISFSLKLTADTILNFAKMIFTIYQKYGNLTNAGA